MDSFFLTLVAPFVLFGLVLLGVATAFAFWLWMLVDCARLPDDASEPSRRVVWILVLVFANFAGALLYYFAVKRVGGGQGGSGTARGGDGRFPRHEP